MTGKIHEGRNIKRIREILGIKQDALAIEMGNDWNQKKVSLLEQKEVIEPFILEEVAKALRVPAEAIKNFNEEAAVNIIATNCHDYSASVNYHCTFNPIEKWVEAINENKKLYERLLQTEKERIALLESMLHKKQAG